MPETLTQQQAAETVGVTSRRMRQLDGEKDPPQRDADGNYPAVQFGKWLQARTRKALGVSSDGGVYDYEGERARLTKAQAEKTELEVNELRGDLVRGSIVEAHWQGMVAAMRGRLVALPSKIAPQVATPENLRRAQDLIEGVIHEALAEISGDAFPNAIRNRLDRKGDTGDAGASASADEDDRLAMGKRVPAIERGRQLGNGSVPKRPNAVPRRNPRRAK